MLWRAKRAIVIVCVWEKCLPHSFIYVQLSSTSFGGGKGEDKISYMERSVVLYACELEK
jgi:hypothetical protein